MKLKFKKPYVFITTPEYEIWFESESHKSQVQIEDRLEKIEEEGYFGDTKSLGDGTSELRWINGRRLYYAYISELDILLLLGGNKNGQDKDITKAKKILRKYTEVKTKTKTKK